MADFLDDKTTYLNNSATGLAELGDAFVLEVDDEDTPLEQVFEMMTLNLMQTIVSDEIGTETVQLRALTVLVDDLDLNNIPLGNVFSAPAQYVVGINAITGLIEAGAAVTITGQGTASDPYVVNAIVPSSSAPSFNIITGDPYDNTALAAALDAKEDVFAAGVASQFLSWDKTFRALLWSYLGGTPTTLVGYGIVQGDTLFNGKYLQAGDAITGYTLGPNRILADTDTWLTAQGILQTQISNREVYLGLPAANGYILSSTTTGVRSWIAAPSGSSITAVAIASSNGFAGSSVVAAGTATVTLRTTITGILKGNGTAISAAVEMTDYLGITGAVNGDTILFTGGVATWAPGLSNPMTTLGDIIYGGASGAVTRLAGNTTTTNKFLRSTGAAGVATAQSWEVLVAGDIPTIAQSQVSGLVAALDGKLSDNLPSAQIFVGNLSGLASPVTPSGDWTMTYAGVNVIGANKVTFAKMLQATGPQVLIGTPDILGAQDFRQITLDPATLAIDALGVMSAISAGSGTVTNTGTLTANTVVLGNGTVDVKVVTGFTTDGVSKLTLGVAGSSVGGLLLTNATSGTIELRPVTGALGTTVLSLFAGSDTLVGLAATQALTNKTYNGNTWTAGTGVLTIAAAKTLTASNTLTLTGTDGSSVAFGTGGTVVYTGAITGSGLTQATARILGRITGGTGAIEELTSAQVTAFGALFSTSATTQGLVPGSNSVGATFYLDATGNWSVPAGGGGSGTVTSVGFTGGIVSVATATTTPALTVAGTSGGVVYFSSTSTWASSGLLAANALMIGGGAGAAPSTTTTGAGILTFLGTPSSANLAAAVSGKTGTGDLVFGTTPTLDQPVITGPLGSSVVGYVWTATDTSGNGEWQVGGGGSGVTTMAAIGAVPNADGASISGVTLTLQPADASFGGVVTTGTQTFAGAKTLSSALTISATSNQLVMQTAGAGTVTFTNTSNATSRVITIPALTQASTLAVLEQVQTWTGVQTFGSAGAVSKLAIAGTTSGATTLNANATGTFTCTLPGTTTVLAGLDTTSQTWTQSHTFSLANVTAVPISFTGAGNTTNAAIKLGGAGMQWIDFSGIAGTLGAQGAPTFTNRSIGTKLALYTNLSGSSTDCAIGNMSGAMWFSMFQPASNQSFRFYGGTTLVMTLTTSGTLTLTQNVINTGTLGGLVYTGAINTAQTASTEISSFSWTSAGRQWAGSAGAGTITTQREFLIVAPTYSFSSANTITTAATLAVTAAPTAGTNATITTALAFWVQAGKVKLDGAGAWGGLQTGNAGLASGDLYVDTAANILANGDVIIGRKV